MRICVAGYGHKIMGTKFFSEITSWLISYYQQSTDISVTNRFLTIIESKMKKNKIELFLDSGAFSAWSQGAEINIDDYITFIKKYKKYISVYANLDVIGDPEATLKNQYKMEKAGLKPLPCFHFNEDEKYLKTYLKKYDYIAFGGMVGIHKKKLDAWLNEIFGNYICDAKGKPKVKVHGFGLTSLALLIKYPWYSVDSTVWAVMSRMENVLVPVYKGGEYVYDKLPLTISVSSVSPNLKTKDHINNLPPEKKKLLLKYIKKKGYKLGESKFKREPRDYKLRKNEKWARKNEKWAEKKTRQVEIIVKRGLSNDYKLRDEMNIIYFMDLEKFFSTHPKRFKPEHNRQGFGL